MANRFWVTGGTGNWNSTTNWSATTGGASGASVPGSADIALFNASSGSGTATLDISPTIQALTMTGFTGTLAFGTNKISLNSTGGVYTGATTFTVTGTPLLELTNSTATARTASAGAVTEANSISINVLAGTGNLTLSGNWRNVDFTGYSGQLQLSSRTVYGSLTISTGMTLAAGANTTTFGGTSGTQTITTNGKTLDFALAFNGVGGTFSFADALTQGSTRAFTITNGTVKLKNGVTSTVGAFATSGANLKYLTSTSAGSAATLSQASGTVGVSNLSIKDITATGGATWNAFVENNNINAGGNTGWDFGLGPLYDIEFSPALRSFTERTRF